MKYLGLVMSIFALLGVAAVTLLARDAADDDVDPGSANPVSFEVDYEKALADAGGPLEALYAQGNRIIQTDDAAAELRDRIDALRGTPVVVNEWGSWCPPCRAEFPIFQEVSAARGENVAFLGIDAREPSLAAAKNWLASYPVPYPSIYDLDQTIHRDVWDLRPGLPATGFYDETGERVFVHWGPYLEAADLEADIRKYLG
ncbi:TlpA family protein disulfide reductase [Thermoleophilia bacterium SCSIO 60948]|nr:TlpA family protein disulfide reductase [Thermoleophilia bacterium SCSIO 60948]